MSHDLEGLPPHLVAALKSPAGTTVDDIRARFPELGSPAATAGRDAEFRRRFEDASYYWHRSHSWSQMPPHVREQIADQVRADMVWEAAGGHG